MHAQTLVAPGVTAANQVGGTSVWHHLSLPQATSILYQQWHIIPWSNALQQNGLGGTNVATVFQITGSGPGRAHAMVAPQVFG